jgi:hypothetical protein
MRIAVLATPSTAATATRSGSSLALLNWPYRWVQLDILAGATRMPAFLAKKAAWQNSDLAA